ncbi:MAG TPA: isocitrate lyase/phosphoenolpyruvate mutase family protein [Ktedonobacteraceae bacterium]|jgi:phosphoenolpyruvate phosphomutase|nr:isocitrate lyase/phosphoenolpyruvate mutase family protein [Ktedonobacteraceae bacterium]
MKRESNGYLAGIRAAGRYALGVGVHNAITASLVEQAGYQVLWLSSLEVSASKMLPDANVITLSEMGQVLREITSATRLPVLVDADNGYGSDETARRAAQEFQAAGATAMCIEDNAFPKRGSFYANVDRHLEDIDTFCRRIRKVRQSVGNQLEIIARTEGLIAGIGVRDTIRRAYAYREAGADALFIQTNAATQEAFMEVLSEVRELAPIVITPTSLPAFSAPQLHAAGADIIIYSNVIIRSILKTVSDALSQLKREQRLGAVQGQMAPLGELFDVTRAYEWLDLPEQASQQEHSNTRETEHLTELQIEL